MVAPTAFALAASGTASSFIGLVKKSTCDAVPRAARGPSRKGTRWNRVARRPSMTVYDVEIEFHGKSYTIPVDEDQTLLEGIEAYGLTVPYSCRAGVCMTCAAKIVGGTIDLGEIALMNELKDEGFVLTCSAKPRSEGVKLVMNQFDEVYEKQYGQFEKDRQ